LGVFCLKAEVDVKSLFKDMVVGYLDDELPQEEPFEPQIEICSICGGDGIIDRMEMVCCGHYLEDGQCCGNFMPDMDKDICWQCRGNGIVERV
jgi:hypothetical protein